LAFQFYILAHMLLVQECFYTISIILSITIIIINTFAKTVYMYVYHSLNAIDNQ